MNLFSYLKSLWPVIKKYLAKTLIQKLLPRIVGGPWSWIATFFGEKVVDKVVKPIWLYLTRKGYAITKRVFRRKKVGRLENAKTESDFDSSFDDLP